MAMTCDIGVIKKNINSTKRTFETGQSATHTIHLLDHTSREAPVMRIEGVPVNNANYMIWGDNCYWIDDIRSVTTNMYEIQCHRDPLATFRNSIVGNAYYIKYGNVEPYKLGVPDDRLCPGINVETKVKQLYNEMLIGSGVLPFDWDGTYFIRAYSQYSDTGGVFTYAVKGSVLTNFMTNFNSWCGSSIESPVSGTSLSNAFAKFSGMSWIDNIQSITYVPIDYSWVHDHGVGVNELVIGAYRQGYTDTNDVAIISSYKFARIDRDFFMDWPMKKICDDAGDSTDVRDKRYIANGQAYTLGTFVHPCGAETFDLSSLVKQRTPKVHINMSFILTTGDYCIKFYDTKDGTDNDELKLLCEAHGTIGVDMKGIIGAGGNNFQTFFKGASKAAKMIGQYAAGSIPGAAADAGSLIGKAGVGITNRSQIAGGYIGGSVGTQIAMTGANIGEKAMDLGTNVAGLGAAHIDPGLIGALGGNSEPTQITGSCGSGLAGILVGDYNDNHILQEAFKIIITSYIPEILYETDQYDQYTKRYGWPIEKMVIITPEMLTTSPSWGRYYIQTAFANVWAAGATPVELSAINRYMNGSGIYLEQ